MNFNAMTVKTKLSLSFGVLAALVLVVSGLALYALSEINGGFAQYVHGVDARARIAADVRAAVDRRAIAARNLVLVTKPADVELEKAAVQLADSDVKSSLRKLNDSAAAAGSDTSEQARAMIAEIGRIEAQYGPVAADIENDALNGRHDDAVRKIDENCRPLLAQLVKATDAFSAYTETRAERKVKRASDLYASQRVLLFGICAAAAVAAFLAALLITRSITRALGAEPSELSDITRRIAEGDLGTVAGAQAAPQGSVLASMSTMQTGLVQLIGQVRATADNIATGASQIAAGNVDLSSRTEEQAASLEETASSMEELTSTVRQNAENAQQASSLAANASEVASKGSDVVGQVVATMTEISESSTKIADITGLIEGIAFQTNILALNAAVEAARAGEQGRGFAVVATEVRSLAQRSSSAAKEIKELIGASVQKIHDGSSLAGEAGKTMTEVTQAVARVTDIMGEIAAASTEQSRGIEQVNQAITQMDEVTQQNAALVEEAAAASKSLEDQGRVLNEAIAFFRLDDAGRVTQTARRTAPTSSARAVAAAPSASSSRSVAPRASQRAPAREPSKTKTQTMKPVHALAETSDANWKTF
ncbi:MAG TPA: methyl-accepting chemotaxis protein [Trinickia sp.]|uniref:methyl-accepting chemotaxis protein n=1 Tax=Trinickia sp. TaxID=2571163 RepID=UPI002CE30C76|nr:methyl-accepting chemotaxis protein [Trinickia sp.]HVW48805.1 methyl-accepting chemotaxis protein [Trinickia sp.]